MSDTPVPTEAEEPTFWEDAAGHPIRPADDGRSIWVHQDGPIPDCAVVGAFAELKFEQNPDVRLTWPNRKREIGFELDERERSPRTAVELARESVLDSTTEIFG